MKKILIVIGGFTPAVKYGGPVVSIENMCALIGDQFDMYIVTRDHDLGSQERLKGISEGWNILENCKVNYIKEADINYKFLLGIVEILNPDCVYINSFFGAKFTIPILKIARNKDVPVILAPRGELCVNALKMKKSKKYMYIHMMKKLYLKEDFKYQSTSIEESNQIQKVLNVKKENIVNLLNIPTIPKTEIVSSVKLENRLKCIFLSRINRKKNLVFAIKALKGVNLKVEFDIYGPKEDFGYWEEIEEEIKRLPSNIDVNYKGIVNRENIHETFSKYNIFLFPTLSENYGHVLVESMLSGCPVVTSDQTPWTDMNDFNAGWAIPLVDEYRFTEVLTRVAAMNQNEYRELSNNCKKYIYDKLKIEELKSQYLDIFNNLLNK